MSETYLLVTENGRNYIFNTRNIAVIYEDVDIDFKGSLKNVIVIGLADGRRYKFAKSAIKTKFVAADAAMYQHLQMLLENGGK